MDLEAIGTWDLTNSLNDWYLTTLTINLHWSKTSAWHVPLFGYCMRGICEQTGWFWLMFRSFA